MEKDEKILLICLTAVAMFILAISAYLYGHTAGYIKAAQDMDVFVSILN